MTKLLSSEWISPKFVIRFGFDNYDIYRVWPAKYNHRKIRCLSLLIQKNVGTKLHLYFRRLIQKITLSYFGRSLFICWKFKSQAWRHMKSIFDQDEIGPYRNVTNIFESSWIQKKSRGVLPYAVEWFPRLGVAHAYTKW